MNNIVIAYRPGPSHRWYRHEDYGQSQAWSSEIIGPINGEIVDGEYVKPKRLRAEGWEVIVHELPNYDDLYCQNPECPEYGRCNGECVRNF